MNVKLRRTIIASMVAMMGTPLTLTSSIAQVAPMTKSEELLAKAPVLAILLDNSGSSPATQVEFIKEAVKLVDAKVRTQPLGTMVRIFTVGTAEAASMTFSTRILAKVTAEGATIELVAQKVREIVMGFPARIKNGEIQEHGTSHLVAGLFDAERILNRKAAKNTVIFLTDGVENSSLANCYKDAQCRLPKPQFDLTNTEVVMLGVGAGLPSNQEMAVIKSWENLLKLAKADPVVVRKIF
jgi:von Willebrand factor type A domain